MSNWHIGSGEDKWLSLEGRVVRGRHMKWASRLLIRFYFLVWVLAWWMGSTFWKIINMYFCELYVLLCVLCCCWDTKLCLSLCNSMNCSMPGFPVLHCFLEFAHIHVHLVDDAIQPSHPFSSCPPSFPASGSFPTSWLFTSGKELELQLQYQYFQWIFSVDPLELTGLIFLLSKGFSRVL